MLRQWRLLKNEINLIPNTINYFNKKFFNNVYFDMLIKINLTSRKLFKIVVGLFLVKIPLILRIYYIKIFLRWSVGQATKESFVILWY